MREWGERATFRQKLRRFIDRAFPERQVHLRTRGRISFFRIPQWFQVSAALLAAVFSGWVGYSTFSYVQHDEIVGAKNTQIADARKAYDDLLSDVTAYQRRFVELTRELEDNHNLMLSLVERNATLQRNLSTVEKRLENTESERENVAGAREVLRDKLSRLEGDMRSLSTKNFSLRDNLMSVETDLQSVVRERDDAHHRNTELQSQVAMLEDRLNNLQSAQDIAVDKMTERTMAYIGSLEKVIEIAGIEVDSLLASSDGIVGKVAQGGPFIPVKPEDAGGQLMQKLTRPRRSPWSMGNTTGRHGPSAVGGTLEHLLRDEFVRQAPGSDEQTLVGPLRCRLRRSHALPGICTGIWSRNQSGR